MPFRFLLLALVAVTAQAQSAYAQFAEGEQLNGPALEAAQKANPDDQTVTARLLRFYAAPNNDPDWVNRFSLLSWNIQHHPDANFLVNMLVYQNMQQPLRDQLKQMWIAQVHQHADNAQVLRNAAAGIDPARIMDPLIGGVLGSRPQSGPPFPSSIAGGMNPTQAIRIGGNVQAQNILHKVNPEYPEEARQARIQGTVRFQATIGQDGHIQNLQLESGHPIFVRSATEAVQQWTYRPTLLNGSPVAVATTIDVNYTLQP